ncbi:unnamed protein product [Rotaria sp. Silwood2]|nr:unnamed protein product [Rotaria sp. Silwood2]CAF4011449.1 unnamed protein product [Rotaria sp. Silwood2]
MITVNSPSPKDFEYLWELHPDTLQCLCSQIAVSYSDFIVINSTFHQLCSSRIISPDWYNLLTLINLTAWMDARQFERGIGDLYFQILDMFCSLAENTFVNAYQLFSAKTFINTILIPETLFSKQVSTLIDTFITTVRSEFIRILAFVCETIQESQLANRTMSNYVLMLDDNSQVMMYDPYLQYIDQVSSIPIITIYSCQFMGYRCGAYSCIYNSSDTDCQTYITGLIVRCLPIESALSSTLDVYS